MEKKNTLQLTKKQRRSYALGAIPGGLLAYVFGLYYIDFFYQDVGMNFEYMVLGLIIRLKSSKFIMICKKIVLPVDNL